MRLKRGHILWYDEKLPVKKKYYTIEESSKEKREEICHNQTAQTLENVL